MGKLTRPSGIMISAISITTFRQIHYLLSSLPGRTAKHCSRMERERKTLNSALLPTERKKKNWHCGSFFSLAKAKLLFPLFSRRTREGGPELHTILNMADQSPLSGCRRIFLHSSHLCSPGILIPCHPKLYSRTAFFFCLFPSQHSLHYSRF